MIAWIYQAIVFWILIKIISLIIHTRVHVTQAIERYTVKTKPDEACAGIFLAYQTVETAFNTWSLAGNENRWLEPWYHLRPYVHDFFNTLKNAPLDALKNDTSNPTLAKILLFIFSDKKTPALSDEELKTAPHLAKLMYKHHRILSLHRAEARWDLFKSYIKSLPFIERQIINWNTIIVNDADLSHGDLRAISMYEKNLERINSYGADFSQSYLRHISFTGCILTHITWSKANLQDIESCQQCELDEHTFKHLQKGGCAHYQLCQFTGAFDSTPIHHVNLFGSVFLGTLYRPSFNHCQLAMVLFNQMIKPLLSKSIGFSTHDTMKRIESSILKLFASPSKTKQEKAQQMTQEYNRALQELHLRGSQPERLSADAWLLFLKDINAKHLLNALSVSSGMLSLKKLFLPNSTPSVHRVQNTTGNTSTATTKRGDVGVGVTTVVNHQSKP